MERILGIDYGQRRVGLSISDPLGITAQRLETLNVLSPKDAKDGIIALLEERPCSLIVMGMPRNMNGSKGFKADETEQFGAELEALSGLKVVFCDERLTSVIANQVINSTVKRKLKRREIRKKEVDGISAQLILQSYLDKKSFPNRRDDFFDQ